MNLDAIGVDSLLAAVDRITTEPATITIQTSGEFEGQAYVNTETVVSDPQRSLAHVSVDYSDFGQLLDGLVPRVLEAQEQSGAEEQSLLTTALLAFSLSADSGEYWLDGETRWQTANESPEFKAIKARVSSFSAQAGEDPADHADFGESLNRMWLGTPVRENEAPPFLGHGGSGLPEYLAHRLQGSDADQTLRITDQRSDGDRLRVTIETVESETVVLELDTKNSIRTIQFQEAAGWLGDTESVAVTLEPADTSELGLPPEELRLDEDGFEQLLLEDLAARFPDAFEEEQQPSAEIQFQEIDSQLSG